MRGYSDPERFDPSLGLPDGGKPHITAGHIDGPLLVFRDGQMHWLTLWERFLFACGLTDAWKIERKRRPNLVRFMARNP